jgi:hypothetical protein
LLLLLLLLLKFIRMLGCQLGPKAARSRAAAMTPLLLLLLWLLCMPRYGPLVALHLLLLAAQGV